MQLVHEATGFKKCSINHASYTAKAFPPEKRFSYNYNSLRFMKPFKNADGPWTDAFLARHQDDKLSSRDLRALAQEEYGAKDDKSKKPVKVKASDKCSVTIRTDLYARLRMYNADGKISVMVDRILEDWISKQPNAPAVTIFESKKDLHVREVNERKAARLKLKEERAAVLANKRADYATRRQAQLDAGAKPIVPKPARKKRGKLHRQWVDCVPIAMIDGEYGPTVIQNKSSKFATKFFSEESAQAAEQEVFKAKGFHELVVHCDVCSKSSRRDVWHVKHRYSASEPVAQEKTASMV